MINKKLLLNIITILILACAIGLIFYFSFSKYDYKLETNDLIIYSDSNIVNKINDLQDTNNILIFIDNTKNINFGNLILFVQIYSAKHKQIEYMIYDENCHYNNLVIKKQTITNKDNCYKLLDDKNYPKIILKDLDTKIEKTKIEIKNNNYYITLKNPTKDSEKILRFIFSDYDEISKIISQYTQDYIKNQS